MTTGKSVMVVESFNKTAFKDVTSDNKVPAGMMMVEGVLGVVDVVNRNNRIYSREEYVTHVTNLNQRIQESNGVLGELEHPKSMTINLNNISHKVMSVEVQENGNVWGKILLLDTPKGKIAQSVVRSGSPLPISSRAQGQVQENGNVKLSHLSTYDLVGTAGFAQAALTESVVVEGQVVLESYVFDLNENGAVIESAPDSQLNENSNIDYAVIETMLQKMINAKIADGSLQKVTIAEGEENTTNIQEMIDEAMLKTYLPLIESWVSEEFAPTIAESVQQWVTEEFAPVLETWVITEFAPVMESWVVNEFAPVVETWVVNEFAPVVEGWMIKEFAPVVEGWMINEFAPVMESWVIGEFGPVMEAWVTEEVAPMISENGGTGMTKSSIQEMIAESIKDLPTKSVNEDNEELNTAKPFNAEFTQVDKNAEVFKSELLSKLDEKIDAAGQAHDEPAKDTDKPAFVDESAFNYAPAWLKNCPTEFKHIWSQLNESNRNEIYRRASVRHIVTNEDVNTFWQGINFQTLVENGQSNQYKRTPVVINENGNEPVNPRLAIASIAKNLQSNN